MVDNQSLPSDSPRKLRGREVCVQLDETRQAPRIHARLPSCRSLPVLRVGQCVCEALWFMALQVSPIHDDDGERLRTYKRPSWCAPVPGEENLR